MNKLTKAKYIIAEKLNKLYAKRLNEQATNPFNNPPSGAGTGPNWSAAAAQWQNFYNNNYNSSLMPPPPQPFLNRMATMGCPQKIDRFMVLIGKWQNLFPGNTSTGQLNPNNPMWQSQMLSKLHWLTNDLSTNC